MPATAATQQLRSATQTSLCVDDGGATASNPTSLGMKPCDADSDDQKFAYNSIAWGFSNPTKNGLCVDDGGATGPWTATCTLLACDSSSANQKIEVVKREMLLAAIPTLPTAMQNGDDIMLRVAGNDNLCLNGGDGSTSGPSTSSNGTCDPSSLIQVFQYDMDTQQLRSSATDGLCLDDGGTPSGMFRSVLCDKSSDNQQFDIVRRADLFTGP